MLSDIKEGSGRSEKEPHVQGLWQILMPPFLYVVLYSCLQYACLLEFRHLRASGPAPVSRFITERPGLCTLFMMFVPMAAALLAVSWEGVRRLRAFGKKKAGEGTRGRSGDRAVILLLLAAAVALCIFFNAQVQAMDLHSQSVDNMQPVYRELPFPVILLFFAGATPLAEEFVFRGLVYTGLRSRFAALPSILVSAALFGLYHGEALQGAYAFCMGIVLGLSMEMTKDIRIPWLLHASANGLPLILSYLGIWEIFLGAGWRAGTLVCFLAFLGLLRAFTAGRKREEPHIE